MTKKRQKKIIAAMPKTVHVERHKAAGGSVYYEVDEADLDAWLSRAGF